MTRLSLPLATARIEIASAPGGPSQRERVVAGSSGAQRRVASRE
jgi:hypothetical protein